MIKIIYLSYIYDSQGVSLAARKKAEELFSRLPQNEFDFKLFWLNEDKVTENSDPESRKYSKLRSAKHFLSKFLHEPNQLIRNIKYYSIGEDIIEEEKPDLIISRLDVYNISSLLLSKQKKVPLVFEVDCPVVYEFRTFEREYFSNKFLLEYVEKMNLAHARANFVISNELKKYYIRRGIPPQHLEVITNGADIEKINPFINADQIKKRYHLYDAITIGFIGTFHYWHGLNSLLDVAEEILQSEKNVKFLLVGSSGPLKNQIENIVKKNNLGEHIFLTGKIHNSEVPKYLAAIDIAIAPYPNLPFFYYSPMKIFEYMAAGKAIVASKIGQIAEILQDKKNSLLFTPGNIREMKDKIEMLIKNRDLIYILGNQAREDIIKFHSWDRKSEQLSRFIKKLLE